MPAANPKSPIRNRKSGIVIPHSPKWHQRLAARLVWLLVSLISLTIRFRLHDPHGFFKRADMKQAAFCFWHNRLALCVK
ncbi:MAG TPA: hypothetical protein VMB22_01100, partial [Verrucomicrobiae bacterium]|nr:hypothetical protein [Verrucomicrobiae bacterium]